MFTTYINYLIVIFTLFLISVLFYIYRYLNVIRYIEKLPGPKPIPIIGNITQVGNCLEEYLNTLLKWWKEYGCDKYRAWVFFQPYVFITDPKDVEDVLSSTNLIEKGDVYELLKPWLGEGLLISTGLKWHKHRKIITPSFHFKILNEFLDVMDNCGTKFIDKLKILSQQKDNNGNLKSFDVQKMASNYTLDVICESAFGTSMNSSQNINSEVVSSVEVLCELVPQRVFSAIKRFQFLYIFTSDYRKQVKALNSLRNFTTKIIEDKRKSLSNDEANKNISDFNSSHDDNVNIKKKKAFLDNLLTATIDGRPLTFDEIFEEVSTFMFEGHDTTKSAITFGLYILSRYPEIQKKVFEEQTHIFGNDLKRSATYNELQEMHYLELVIKETLRLYPSVPIIARYTREPYNLGNIVIPPCTSVVIFLFAMGRNEKYFPNPLKVNPNRFEKENREEQNPFDSVPFSAGPRNCIGQKFAMLELKTILSKIVRNFQILPPYDKCCSMNDNITNDSDKKISNDSKMLETLKNHHHEHDVTDICLEPPKLCLAITLKSENGVRIRLKLRE